VSDLIELIAATGLLRAGEPVVVLVSGGRDSVCLLDAASRLCGPAHVLALHVNYGLRVAADDEEELVRAHANQLGTGLEVLRVDRADTPSGNLQAWARDVRLGEGARLAAARHALLATGHTASDQAETVLYRLAASPGRRALLGMSARDGRLVRPLLHLTREQTAAHCDARGLRFAQDASNEDPRFARARVRGELLPALARVHPAAAANLVRTAELLRAEAAVLDEVVDTALAGRDRIALEHLGALPHALARLVLVRLAEDAAGTLVPQAAGRLEAVLALGGRGGTASLDLGGGARAVVEYGVLRVARHDERGEGVGPASPSPPSPTTLELPGEARFGRWELQAAGAPAGASLPPFPLAGVACEQLDGDALGPRLLVRAWQPGDRIAPLGLGGTRTLADLFIDRRIPRERRRAIPVLVSGTEIAWVPGVAVSERFRLTRASRRVIALCARELGSPGGEEGYTPASVGMSSSSPPAGADDPRDDAIGDVLVSASDLQRRVGELGVQISGDYAGRRLLLIGVLKGAVFFLSDLMRSISIPVEVDFMAVASYGSATDSSGVVRILKDLDAAIEGRDVLIVEDIVDSGLTLHYLMRNLGSRNPASLEVCALLTKPERRKVDLHTRYVGFEIPDRFAIGYGLDYAERYRNLPYVAALNPGD
jgi:tRNA(Ile)-lysidine synthase